MTACDGCSRDYNEEHKFDCAYYGVGGMADQVEQLKLDLEAAQLGIDHDLINARVTIKRLNEQIEYLKVMLGDFVSRWLEYLMNDRLEDGTLVLDIVFAQDPELRDQFRAALFKEIK